MLCSTQSGYENHTEHESGRPSSWTVEKPLKTAYVYLKSKTKKQIPAVKNTHTTAKTELLSCNSKLIT